MPPAGDRSAGGQNRPQAHSKSNHTERHRKDSCAALLICSNNASCIPSTGGRSSCDSWIFYNFTPRFGPPSKKKFVGFSVRGIDYNFRFLPAARKKILQFHAGSGRPITISRALAWQKKIGQAEPPGQVLQFHAGPGRPIIIPRALARQKKKIGQAEPPGQVL